MTEQTKSVFDLIDEFDESENRPAGIGLVGLTKIEYGYKVFAKGISNDASWFPFDLTSDVSRKAALDKARDFAETIPPAVENGKEKKVKPIASIMIQVKKGKELTGSDKNWNEDRTFVTATFSQGYTEIIKPRLKETNITHLGEYWANVKFAPDPRGQTRTNQDGEVVPATVAFISHIFESEDAARKFVAENAPQKSTETTKESSQEEVPAGYLPAAWNSVKAEIVEAYKTLSSTMPPAIALTRVAKDYAVEPRFVTLLIQ